MSFSLFGFSAASVRSSHLVSGNVESDSWASERARLAGLFRQVQRIPALGDCSQVAVSGPVHSSSHSQLFLGQLANGREKFLIKCCYLTDSDEADAARARLQYDALVELNAAFKGSGELNLVQPLHLFETEGVIVQSWIEGRALDELFADNGTPVRRLKELVRAAGEWLGHYHRSSGVERGNWTNRGLVAEIEESAKALGKRGDRLLRAVRQANLSAVVGGDSIQAVASLHCDFKPANLIASERGISAIDFQVSKRASIYFDLAHFLNSVAIDAVRASRPSVLVNARALHTAFIEGYERAAGAIDPLMLALYLVYDAVRYLFHQSDVLTAGARGLAKSWVIERLFYIRLSKFKALRRQRMAKARQS